MDEIGGIKELRLKALVEYLQNQKMGSAILDCEIGSYSPIWSATEIAHQLSKIAHKTYTFHQTPLFFVPLRNDKRNAYAYNVKGLFDVISITDTLITSIDKFTFYLGRYVQLSINKSLDGNDVLRSSLSVLQNVNGLQRSSFDILGKILRDGTLAFLIGHELGHLAGGHLHVFGKYRTSAKINDVKDVDQWDEGLANAEISQAGSDTDSSRIFVAHEIDADLQGMKFLASHWCSMMKNEELSEDEKKIYSVLLKTMPLRYFLSLTCVGIAFLLLGVDSFKPLWKNQPSHPLESTRVLIAMKSLANFFPSASNMELNPGASHKKLILEKGFESLILVHATWGQALLQNKPSDNIYTSRDVKVYNELKTQSKQEQHNFLLNTTGINSMFENIEDIDIFLEEHSTIFANEEPTRCPGRRTRAELMVKW